MNSGASLVWFRHDLRLDDNPALNAAIHFGKPIVPVYIWSPSEEGGWVPGSASQWWLHQSLASLDSELHQLGSRLIIRQGLSLETLRDIITETGAAAVFWNRRYEPAVLERDAQIKTMLEEMSVRVKTFNASVLFEPWEVTKEDGSAYQVFSAFWRRCMAQPKPLRPMAPPSGLPSPESWPETLTIEELDLDPNIDWSYKRPRNWNPGTEGARNQLQVFLDGSLDKYADERDRPDINGTSALSPHLHFGEISPRRVWHEVMSRVEDMKDTNAKDAEVFLKELGWREFAYHLLYHFPYTTNKPLRTEFESFPWETDEEALNKWQSGHTGYPIIDAGMRQLLETGWMHNRVRMLVASFLVKDLLIPWQDGARWFWDRLVDADLANNTLGWQWTAGCGSDAAPYFRVFNPTAQGEKFDPQGDLVRRWIPELSKLPAKWIHKPWQAPKEELMEAGIELVHNQ